MNMSGHAKRIESGLVQRWTRYIEEGKRRAASGPVMSVFRELRNALGRLIWVRRRYLGIVVDVERECESYFSSEDKNLGHLKEVAEEIKAKAIEPSFRLIEDTRIELARIADELEGIG
jgi:hypothetical protein